MKAVRPYTKTEQVQTTLTVEQRERLDAYAEKQKVSRADAIRQLVLIGLAEADADDRSARLTREADAAYAARTR